MWSNVQDWMPRLWSHIRGQTKRQLDMKIKKHRNDIKKSSSLSIISKHRIFQNHTFDWENISIILDNEPSYAKRAIFEIIYIKKQIKGLNK